jgi:hypothetical protein
MKLLALLACVCAGLGCGMRTEMISSTDAQVASPDVPPDRPMDLLRERPADLPPTPDLPPDLGPDRLPDLLPDRGPDLLPDLPPDLRRDLPPDLPPDLLPDLPPDLRRDLPPDLPPDLLPDLPPDLRRDLLPDLVPDLPRDLPPDFPPDLLADLVPDLPRERFRDLSPELPPQGDAQCSPGSTQSCSCDNGLAGSRICLANLIYSECGCGTEALLRVKTGVIGTWTGTATTPWLSPYHVTFTFDSYNHYSSKALDGGGTPALYYGTDNDSPNKRYDITDIQANGDATGTIDICFDVGGCNRNKLQAIQLSADLSRLKFYITYQDQYGPLEYDLTRTSP